jgi:hypothetical protein
LALVEYLVMTKIYDGVREIGRDEPDFPATQESQARVRKVPGS